MHLTKNVYLDEVCKLYLEHFANFCILVEINVNNHDFCGFFNGFTIKIDYSVIFTFIFVIIVWWKMVKNRSDLIRFNPRQLSEWIRIIPTWDSFGLKAWFRIGSDSFGLLPRIKFFIFGLVRNYSHWLRYRYRNSSYYIIFFNIP